MTLTGELRKNGFGERLATLTTREMDVLQALRTSPGHSAARLAGQLFVSEACVRFHLRNIYRKLEVKGKIQLLLLCREAGLWRDTPPAREDDRQLVPAEDSTAGS